MIDDPPPTFTSLGSPPVTLTKLKVGVQQHIELGYVRDEVRIDTSIDALGQRMALKLQSYVLAERLPPEQIRRSERVEFEVPESWWQHFKADHGQRWWLRWLVRRRPVRTETIGRTVSWAVSLQRYWTYPEARSLPAERFGPPVPTFTIAEEWNS